MSKARRLTVLLLSGLLALSPLAGCGAEGQPEKEKPMGRYIEEQWELPESEAITGLHVNGDGKVAFLAMKEENNFQYYTISGSGEFREETAPWLEALKPSLVYPNSLHFNTVGEGVIAYYGAPVGEAAADYNENELRYRVALIDADGTVTSTPIGDEGDPWADRSVFLVDADDFSSQESGEDESGVNTSEMELTVADSTEVQAASGQDDKDGDAKESSDVEVNDGNSWFYPEKVFLGDDGTVYITAFGKTGCFDPASGKMLAEYGDNSIALTVLGNEVAQLFTTAVAAETDLNLEKNSLVIFDSAGKEERRLSAEQLRFGETGRATMTGDGDGSLYVAESSGLYRVASGGESWEQIIDGALCSLSSPTMTPMEIEPHGDNQFLILYYEDGYSLMNYTYSPDTPTFPDQELTVYTMVSNPIVSKAAAVFRKTHPEVLVTIRTAKDDDAGMSGDDARKALNTELLAGKGPDLMIMESLPLESFIEKGILVDLADVVNPMIESGELLNSVASTYQEDGKIFAVPTRFTLPTIWGRKEAIAASADLDQLVAYSEANPDKRMFGNMAPEQLLFHFSLGYWNSFFGDDGQIDTAALADYFESVKRLWDTAGGQNHLWEIFARQEKEEVMGMADATGSYTISKSAESYWDRRFFTNSDDSFGLAYQKCEMMLAHLNGFRSIASPNGAVALMYGQAVTSNPWQSGLPDAESGEYFRLLPAIQPGVYCPASVVGINASSTQQELAKEFLKAMLSEECQTPDLDDGFPVNQGAIEANVRKDEGWYMSSGYTNDDGSEMTIEYGSASQAMKQAVVNHFATLETPVEMDYFMMEEIMVAFEQYYSGKISAGEAADLVAEGNKIALAE